MVVVPNDKSEPLVSHDPRTCEEAEREWNYLHDSLCEQNASQQLFQLPAVVVFGFQALDLHEVETFPAQCLGIPFILFSGRRIFILSIVPRGWDVDISIHSNIDDGDLAIISRD